MHNEFYVKGNPGVGKSTLLGTIYLKSLLDYANGNSCYLPFYYNIQFSSANDDHPTNQSSDIMSFYDCKMNSLINYINDCYEYAKSKNVTPLIIIDGLNEKLVWDRRIDSKSIEETVMNLLDVLDDSYVNAFACNPKHLLGVDDFTDLNLTTVGALKLREQRGLRLDGVMVSLMPRYKQRLIKMVEAYYMLFNDSTSASENAENFYKKCLDLRIIDVDYHFLETNAEDILSKANRSSIVTLLNKKISTLFTVHERKILEQCAYELEVNGNGFSECYEKCKSENQDVIVNYWNFAKIVEKPDIRRFLAANYIVRVFSFDWTNNIYLSSIDIFINRRIMTYIKQLMAPSNRRQQLKELYTKFDSNNLNIHEIGLCNLAYIFSYFGCDADSLFDISKDFDDTTKELIEHQKMMSTIFVPKRGSKKSLVACSYIESLIVDSEKREFVRRYQRLYYGDLDSREWNKSNEDTLQKGFDYFRCFQILSVKISNSLESSERYKLLEYDLFTLCDLTFTRLQNPSFEDVNSTEIKTLFYDPSYVARKEILKCLIDLLDKYLGEAGPSPKVSCTGDNPLVHHYFDYAKSEFKKILEIYDQSNQSDSVLLDTCARQYNSLLMYLNSERLGWRIRSSMANLNESDFKALAQENKIFNTEHKLVEVDRRAGADPEYEVISEFESNKVASVMLIAQLFLPSEYKMLPEVDVPPSANIDLTAYNKSTIMALLLLRYCGKGQSGDCTPAASSVCQSKIMKEQHEYTCDILMPFILQGKSDLGNVFELINQDYVSEHKQRTGNINLIIASEIEMIQMEYQYYLASVQYSSRHANSSYFSSDRKKEFEKDFDGKINYCKYIEKALINDNPIFKGIL